MYVVPSQAAPKINIKVKDHIIIYQQQFHSFHLRAVSDLHVPSPSIGRLVNLLDELLYSRTVWQGEHGQVYDIRMTMPQRSGP